MQSLSIKNFKTALAKADQRPFLTLQNRAFRPVLTDHNEPIKYYGTSSVVFKITDGEKYYALKCYVTDLFGRWDYLRKVQEELRSIQKDWLVGFEIYEDELRLEDDGGNLQTCSVLLMPWVEGENLLDKIKNYCNTSNRDRLQILADSMVELACSELAEPFCQGDVTPENIIVSPIGKMVLIDHDTFVFEGWKNITGQASWSIPYHHPHRHSGIPDLHASDFSFLLLTICLKALRHNPDLFQQFNSRKGLLFSVDDYKRIDQSPLVKKLEEIQDDHLHLLLKLFILQLQKSTTAIPDLQNFLNNSIIDEQRITLEAEYKALIQENHKAFFGNTISPQPMIKTKNHLHPISPAKPNSQHFPLRVKKKTKVDTKRLSIRMGVGILMAVLFISIAAIIKISTEPDFVEQDFHKGYMDNGKANENNTSLNNADSNSINPGSPLTVKNSVINDSVNSSNNTTNAVSAPDTEPNYSTNTVITNNALGSIKDRPNSETTLIDPVTEVKPAEQLKRQVKPGSRKRKEPGNEMFRKTGF